jgi:hypothetical protein
MFMRDPLCQPKAVEPEVLEEIVVKRPRREHLAAKRPKRPQPEV